MNSLPIWALWIQWGGTIFIAGFVAFIGYRQWRTAHERVVLDLFEKRYEIIDRLHSIIGGVIREGRAPTATAIEFLRGTQRATFLFGAEVNAYLDETYRLLIQQHLCDTRIEANGPDHHQWVEREAACFAEISKFNQRFQLRVEPYMRMHQKAPWSPRLNLGWTSALLHRRRDRKRAGGGP
jgi:hypothetical protein